MVDHSEIEEPRVQSEAPSSVRSVRPCITVLNYQAEPDIDPAKFIMLEFRLVYRGPLEAASRNDTRTNRKQSIRRFLHPQLKALHEQYHFLSVNVEHWANQYSRLGFRFVPLITPEQGQYCSLDILFLRRERPGNLIQSGGDLDNRLKVLMDGLRVPDTMDEMGKDSTPQSGEDPFYCLLHNDSAITKISVTTDTLLRPPTADEGIHDVELVIAISTVIPTPQWYVTY